MNENVKNILRENRLCYKYDVHKHFLTVHIPVDTHAPDSYVFKCPFCVEYYKKNGEPYKKAKPIVHFHGHQLGSRTPHCKNEARVYHNLPPFEFNLVPQECILCFK